MTSLRTTWSAYLDQQHRYPTGLIGQIIGAQMVGQHAPETAWSMHLLNLQPTDRVLEIGCGAGQALALALKQHPHPPIIGIDLSTTMLRSATRRNQTAIGNGQLCLVRGDVAALPFHNHYFDKIVSIHTFYFWLDWWAIMAQIVGLLAAGGRCVTTFATARTAPTGERMYWALHEQAEALVAKLDNIPHLQASLIFGPDSREFNNVAIVLEIAIANRSG